MSVTADFFEITPRNTRARLAISVEVMRELSRHADPEEMYRVFTHRMNQLYPTSRQITLSRHGVSNPEFRVTRFNLWADGKSRESRRPVLSGGILADLLYSDEPHIIDDLNLDGDDPALEYLDGQRSLLAIPLFDKGISENMMVVTREEPAAFPQEQVPELVWMTNLFGRAMQTLVLSGRLKTAYEAADYELRSVAELQRSLLPPQLPTVPNLDIAVHYRAANRAGGDYYDFFPLPEGKFGVMIADVSGHGTHSAVLMAITHSLAHTFPGSPRSPGRLLAYLNSHLARRYTGATGNFVTAFYAVFDPARSVMIYANAGHLPPRAATVTESLWHPLPNHSHLPLGVDPRDGDYHEEIVPFGPGDRVVLFTDGMVDAINRSGDAFGLDRFDAALGDFGVPAARTIENVLGELDRFTFGTHLTDDRTLVVVRRI